MFCIHCAKKNTEEGKFCCKCGIKLSQELPAHINSVIVELSEQPNLDKILVYGIRPQNKKRRITMLMSWFICVFFFIFGLSSLVIDTVVFLDYLIGLIGFTITILFILPLRKYSDQIQKRKATPVLRIMLVIALIFPVGSLHAAAEQQRLVNSKSYFTAHFNHNAEIISGQTRHSIDSERFERVVIQSNAYLLSKNENLSQLNVHVKADLAEQEQRLAEENTLATGQKQIDVAIHEDQDLLAVEIKQKERHEYQLREFTKETDKILFQIELAPKSDHKKKKELYTALVKMDPESKVYKDKLESEKLWIDAENGVINSQFRLGIQLIQNQDNLEQSNKGLKLISAAIDNKKNVRYKLSSKDIINLTNLAEQGYLPVQLALLDIYQSQTGVKKDSNAAFHIATELAHSGNADGQYMLGVFYALYDGDYPTSFKWSEKAAQQGHVNAQLMVAMMYSGGRAVNKNAQQSLEWHLLAAKNGSLTSMSLLANDYAIGIQGVPQSWYLSYMFASLKLQLYPKKKSRLIFEKAFSRLSSIERQKADKEVQMRLEYIKSYREEHNFYF